MVPDWRRRVDVVSRDDKLGKPPGWAYAGRVSHVACALRSIEMRSNHRNSLDGG